MTDHIPLTDAELTEIETPVRGYTPLDYALRLVADLRASREKADTYQRMYYAEHGEIAQELAEAKAGDSCAHCNQLTGREIRYPCPTVAATGNAHA